jgi:hypothetical protein
MHTISSDVLTGAADRRGRAEWSVLNPILVNSDDFSNYAAIDSVGVELFSDRFEPGDVLVLGQHPVLQ